MIRSELSAYRVLFVNAKFGRPYLHWVALPTEELFTKYIHRPFAVVYSVSTSRYAADPFLTHFVRILCVADYDVN